MLLRKGTKKKREREDKRERRKREVTQVRAQVVAKAPGEVRVEVLVI